MAAKKVRVKVKMVSTAGTGVYYTTTKNPRNTTAKMQQRKYDKKLRKTVLFKEEKIKYKGKSLLNQNMSSFLSFCLFFLKLSQNYFSLNLIGLLRREAFRLAQAKHHILISPISSLRPSTVSEGTRHWISGLLRDLRIS